MAYFKNWQNKLLARAGAVMLVAGVFGALTFVVAATGLLLSMALKMETAFLFLMIGCLLSATISPVLLIVGFVSTMVGATNSHLS